jgi:AcrR family transcriptional regulator
VVSKESTGAGDLRRSLELLWRGSEPGRRGPKQRLSTDEVVEAAIALADAHGIEALSMRKVAEAVGVSPMSLYTYVPAKAELLDLMFDRVLGETDDPDEELPGWRAKLAFVARQRWALTERHPWLLDLALHRPPLGPNVMRKAESAMRTFEGMGLAPEEMGLAAEALQNYVTGALHAAREAREAERRTGMTDAEWFSAITEILQGRFEGGGFPAMKRLREARGEDRTPMADSLARFEFGLERMLDGLEAFICARRPA